MASEGAPLHICLVCMELFGFGSTGGFGRATRMIGRELAGRGHRVTIVTRQSPLSEDRRTDFMLEGMRVRMYSPRRPFSSLAIYRDCKADVFHSQDPSLATLLAMRAMPHARHVVTFRAPLSRKDLRIDRHFGETGWRGHLMHYLQIDNPLVHRAVRRTPHRYVAASGIAAKAMAVFGLDERPDLLPTPVTVPASVEKATRPTVCFVGRWHGIKQPEHFLDLAEACPDIDFIAVGGAPEIERDTALRARYGHLVNLAMPGIIDQFSSNRLSEILARSWIVVNTSLREALPTTFIEAAAHRCAILSYLDSDGFASRFGLVSRPGELAQSLRDLLQGERWRRCGEAAHEHVRSTFSVDAAMDAHIAAYRR
jgi:glycosyltransferase involved in cell wall biosynthesis